MLEPCHIGGRGAGGQGGGSLAKPDCPHLNEQSLRVSLGDKASSASVNWLEDWARVNWLEVCAQVNWLEGWAQSSFKKHSSREEGV